MRTNPSHDLRHLEVGQRVIVKDGVFAGKTGVVLEALDGAMEDDADSAVFFVTVLVRAFGGTAVATFNSPTNDEMEWVQVSPNPDV